MGVGRWGGLLYVGSIAVNTILGSLLAIVAARNVFPSGEAWIAAGVLWAFSLPSFLVLSVLSWFVYVRYRQAKSAMVTGLIYAGNLLVVLAGGFALTYWALLG
jgi:hypothetical protein